MRERFAAGLDDDAAKTSIKTLNSSLATIIDLSLIVKQAHWTLRGRNFIGVHELLDAANANLRNILDMMAERAVILGGTPDGTAQKVAKATILKGYPTDLVETKDHIRELTTRYKEVAAMLREAIDTVSEAGDEGTADLFTEASRTIDKDAWFIGSNSEGN